MRAPELERATLTPGRIALRSALMILMVTMASCTESDTGVAARVGPANPDAAGDEQVATASTPDEFELPPDQLASLSASGANGDGEAAYRVYLHYALGWSSMSSAKEQERWLAYSVENGYEKAWYTTAQNLLQEKSELSCRRAAFWLRRLIDSKDASLVQETRDLIAAEKKYWPMEPTAPICEELTRL